MRLILSAALVAALLLAGCATDDEGGTDEAIGDEPVDNGDGTVTYDGNRGELTVAEGNETSSGDGGNATASA